MTAYLPLYGLAPGVGNRAYPSRGGPRRFACPPPAGARPRPEYPPCCHGRRPRGARGLRAFSDRFYAGNRPPALRPRGAPHYDDERLSLERAIFVPWFCEALLELTPPARAMEEAQPSLRPPSVRHRKRSCISIGTRRAVPQDEGTVAIVDFQDARWGPLPYDLVSFCWDAYVSWTPKDYAPWLAFYPNAGKSARTVARGLRHRL